MSRCLRIHGDVAVERVKQLEERLTGLGSLSRVIRVLAAEGLQLGEVIPMDEYTIDIVVGLPDGLTLVFDTT